MHKRSFGARHLASPILPTSEFVVEEYVPDGMVDEITSDPAFREIAKAIACARHLYMDVLDPDVLRMAIEAGRRRFVEGDFAIGSPHRRRPARGIHEPVVYYAARGELLKIGTTYNIITRMATLGQPELLAVEYGGLDDEAARHQMFASLREQSEWFRHEDPLASYVKVVAEAFPADFGCTLSEWIADLKLQSRHP